MLADRVMASPDAPQVRTAFLSGQEALLEGILLQRRSDGAMNVAAMITGYRGSPLGTFDALLWAQRARLSEAHVTFKPGLNEDIAATACWGTQQLALAPEKTRDGVVAYWYGKGPGVDRSGDVLKHANMAGTMPTGGVVMIVGDDHGAKSSTVAHQSEQTLAAAGIPVLYPATLQEYVECIPTAVAMSRASGLWVAVKCVTEIIEASASVKIPERAVIREAPPPPPPVPVGFQPVEAERSLFERRIPAAVEFAELQEIDSTVIDGPRRRLGLVATGKAYVDLLEALRLLGLETRTAELGIRLYKPLMIWPIAPRSAADFCRGHEEVLVIEEKRSLVEEQLARVLLQLPERDRPKLSGKVDGAGNRLFPEFGELDAILIARVIASRLQSMGIADDQFNLGPTVLPPVPAPSGTNLEMRAPAFCSGCPHNRSTKLPEGSMAFGGIGCHGMAMMVPELRTPAATHMGGEGGNWIGLADFSNAAHIFQNMGEGTYAHSGLLAIRAAVAANVNITYKILYNNATAMTGGQPVEGDFTADDIARQLLAEKLNRVVIVTEYPDRNRSLPKEIEVFPRTALPQVQKDLRRMAGVTALVYEQGCAAERRRLRKRREYPDPAVRTYINPAVCEGCGDCGKKSNCVSLVPVETEFGIRRGVDQESCNKDYSCIEGFCPSFVTVVGGSPRTAAIDEKLMEAAGRALAGCEVSGTQRAANIVIAGIGGSGTITLGGTIAKAALSEGRRVTTFDVTGLAQKNGPVYSHIRILPDDAAEYQPRIPAGQMDVLIACDIVSSAAPAIQGLFDEDRSAVIFNPGITPTAAFQRNPDLAFRLDDYVGRISDRVAASRLTAFSPGAGLARLLGQGALLNVAMVGFALQQGLIPVSATSIEKLFRRGGKPDTASIFAFRAGRLIAVDPDRAEDLLGPCDESAPVPLSALPLPQVIDRCRIILAGYQNERYASAYCQRVAEISNIDPKGDFARHYALNLFKLMRYKDEYEVARLYTAPEFMAGIRREFSGEFKLHFNLAPAILPLKRTPDGEPRKVRFGRWMMSGFRLLAKLRFLRGTVFDPFGRSTDRRLERRLIVDYQAWIAEAARYLDRDYDRAVEIARLPERVRGYGPVKERSVEEAVKRQGELQRTLSSAHSLRVASPV